MANVYINLGKSKHRRQLGQSLIELSLITGVLFLFLVYIVDVSIAWRVKHRYKAAAYSAVRLFSSIGVGPHTSPERYRELDQVARNRFKERLLTEGVMDFISPDFTLQTGYELDGEHMFYRLYSCTRLKGVLFSEGSLVCAGAVSYVYTSIKPEEATP